MYYLIKDTVHIKALDYYLLMLLLNKISYHLIIYNLQIKNTQYNKIKRKKFKIKRLVIS